MALNSDIRRCNKGNIVFDCGSSERHLQKRSAHSESSFIFWITFLNPTSPDRAKTAQGYNIFSFLPGLLWLRRQLPLLDTAGVWMDLQSSARSNKGRTGTAIRPSESIRTKSYKRLNAAREPLRQLQNHFGKILKRAKTFSAPQFVALFIARVRSPGDWYSYLSSLEYSTSTNYKYENTYQHVITDSWL